VPADSLPAALTRVPGSAVPVLAAPGAAGRLGAIACWLGATRILLVTDPGIRAAGHADRAALALRNGAGAALVEIFDGAEENPTTLTIDAGLRAARSFAPDLIVGLGGGSAMDTAKGVNFLLTNGGRMQDYWGVGKATRPMLPMVAVPTTAGTGSEAQSFALITDPDTHQKMACGDRKALARAAVLDPDLTATQPPRVAAATGIDAIAHAVETAATTKRTDASRQLSLDAWRLLDCSFEPAMRYLSTPPAARPAGPAAPLADMLLGAHLAGAAIENSMLGAAHACANPLTAMFGITHGLAVGVMLPHIVRFNAADVPANPYADLDPDPESLARRIEALLAIAGIPTRLAALNVPASAIPPLAALAAKQWTATFNPRPVGPAEFEQIYTMAL